LGDDTYVMDSGVTGGSVVGDGTDSGGVSVGNGGDDHIVINGEVGTGLTPQVIGDNVTGDGGDDTIVINGHVDHTIWADDADGDGGDDTIIINGSVSGSVVGDYVDGDGGNDVIIVNGSTAHIYGDDAGGVGGDDYIEVNGSAGPIDAGGGADSVVIGEDAQISGLIDGSYGFDTLTFEALTQSEADALNPSGGSITINGHTYTWTDFESLIGLLIEQAGRNLRVFFESGGLLAIESANGDGISVFNQSGRIAFISFASLNNLSVDQSGSYNTARSGGWYVTVLNAGADPNHAGHTLYLVSVYMPGGIRAALFSFTN
jgi:hypothetical protein